MNDLDQLLYATLGVALAAFLLLDETYRYPKAAYMSSVESNADQPIAHLKAGPLAS
jgi:hypothetical protein